MLVYLQSSKEKISIFQYFNNKAQELGFISDNRAEYRHNFKRLNDLVRSMSDYSSS